MESGGGHFIAGLVVGVLLGSFLWARFGGWLKGKISGTPRAGGGSSGSQPK